jgi:amino acid adenylation domain-containing protein
MNKSQFNILSFLTKLKAKQISISPDDSFENLRIRGDLKNLTFNEKQEIINNKTKLISFLKNSLSRIQTIETVKTQPFYPISDAQRRLWILSQFEGGSAAYNIPKSSYLNESFEIENFKRAIDATLDRHEILRTVFREDESGEIRQWILERKDLGFVIDYQDYRKENDRKQKADAYIAADSYRAFDLGKGPLLRTALLQVEEKGYVFYINMHHIISDGWSMEVLSKDIIKYYEAYQAGKEPELKQLRIQYKDYSAWQLAQVKEESFKAHREYWLEKLSGELPLLNLPASKQRPKVRTYSGQHFSAYVDKATTAKLNKYTQENGGTLFMGLLASWNVLMYRYTSHKDIIIGTPVAGRDHADLEDQIGFYVNTLALRNEVNPEESFDSFYQAVKVHTLDSYNHQLYPFDRLVEELELQRDTSRSAVFDVMLILQNNGERIKGVELSEEELNQTIDHGYRTSKFDIEVSFKEVGDYLSFQIAFATDVYEKSMVEGLIRHYKQLLQALLENPEQKISQIEYLSQKEKHKLLVTYNDSAVSYKKKTIKELFEEQVIKSSERLALSFEDQTLTYQELNARSNALANCLIKRYNVSKNSKVAVLLDRSVESVISMVAAIKSGACYVSIDPNYPTGRVAYIVEDSAADVIISTEQLTRKHGLGAYQILNLEKAYLGNFETSNPSHKNDLAEACFIIYTSGSTGIPKGVVQTQRTMSNLVQWDVNHSGLERDLKNLQYVSFNFDVHVHDCWAVLCGGGTLYLTPESIRLDFLSLWAFIKNQGIQVLSFAFSTFRQLMDQNSHLNLSVPELKHLICSGEQLIINPTLQKFFEANPQLWLHNHYGPSETLFTTCSTIKSELGINVNTKILIGRPGPNVQIYILDASRNLVAQGVEGEIYIGGDGLAIGYLNKEELTAQRFIESPFTKGERLYKSGDLGMWTKDGQIQCTGRIDDQVRIRGHRIELGEIEHALWQHEEIKQAVVLPKENKSGEKELVAYITSNKTQNATLLRSYLNGILPDFMLPTYYVQLEELPLTTNGKLNKRALPSPEGLGLSSGVEYVAPRNEIEERLVKIWEEVLQRENIGVLDDFFVLGGHSIKAVRLSNEYQKKLAVKLSLEELFQHKSIASHAALIDSSITEEFVQIEQIVPQSNYALSDAQRRLWIVCQSEKASISYNMPGSTYLTGDFNIESLGKAIDATIDRHESLRTVFRRDESGEIRQWILDRKDLGFEIKYKDFAEDQNGYDKAAAFINENSFKPFDLENGPLLIVSLLKVKEDRYIFYFNMHHIISDGWSMEVLTRDVLAYYDAFIENRKPELSPLKIQYKDYSAWQLAQLNKESFKEHKSFWLNKLSGELPLLDLPSAKQRPKVKTNNGRCLQAYINANLTGKLREYSEVNGGSLYIGLLAGWNILMYHYTNQKDIIIGTSIAGRDHADLEDQIGFYSNTLALRNHIEPKESFQEFFRSLADRTLKSYCHQLYPFIRLVEDLKFCSDPSRNAIFDVMVFLQNNDKKVNRQDLNEEEIDAITDKGYRASKFDINVALQEINDCVSLDVTFNPDVYDKNMVEGLIRHYQQLLIALLENPKKNISQIEYLSDKERHHLLHFNNNKDINYSSNKTIVELFEGQVSRTPNNTALVFRNKKLSYNELDKLSNQLAHYLIDNYKIKPDDLIGVMLNRSEWSIVSILGILKAGGAYVPIDPEDPSSRKDFIINDASLRVLITEVNFIHDIDHYDGTIFGIDVEFDPENYRADKPPVTSTPDNLAYVIYTSGSTGEPKGAMITSRAVVDYSFGILNKTNIRECASFGLVSTTSADLGNTVIYTSLLIGGALHVIAKEDILNADKIREFNLDCIKMTPSHWKALQTEECFFTPNKCLILGGESFSEEILKYIKLSNSNCEVFNHYGPTETTIGKLINHVDKNQSAARVSLGRPIGDNKVYILNPNQQLCPVGLPGEICISGVGLAKGYLNQKELTELKFVNNPFVIGEKLYKTGDLGKWLPNGEIEFLGRIDDQVKIRGYRIELEEVKLALLKLDQVEDAIVIVRKKQNNEKELVAYIVVKSEINTSDLRSKLRKSLPEYMIPASYVELESIPLTINGKVDKDSLPDPQIMGIVSGAEYIAPRNDAEEKIIEIIAYILEKPKSQISVYDNFFDLGISSLGLMKLHASINREIGSNLRAASVFEFTTVNALAAYLINGSKYKDAELKEENIAAEMDNMIDLI